MTHTDHTPSSGRGEIEFLRSWLPNDGQSFMSQLQAHGKEGWRLAMATPCEWKGEDGLTCVFQRERRSPSLRPQALTWQALARALFKVERSPSIADQAWFDFQGKAQRLLDALDLTTTPQPQGAELGIALRSRSSMGAD